MNTYIYMWVYISVHINIYVYRYIYIYVYIYIHYSKNSPWGVTMAARSTRRTWASLFLCPRGIFPCEFLWASFGEASCLCSINVRSRYKAHLNVMLLVFFACHHGSVVHCTGTVKGFVAPHVRISHGSLARWLALLSVPHCFWRVSGLCCGCSMVSMHVNALQNTSTNRRCLWCLLFRGRMNFSSMWRVWLYAKKNH